MKQSCFILGLPEAGKTSYLAALWYVLNQRHDGEFRIGKYNGDHTYFAQLSKQWAEGVQLGRTTREQEKMDLCLPLVSTNDNEEIELFVPDLSGETFQEQYEERKINAGMAETIRNCTGLLLFVHCKKIREPAFISSMMEFLDGEEDGQILKSRLPHKDDPTEVQLVELLQFITFLRRGQPSSLSLIISAWDLVEKDASLQNCSPGEFVKLRLPLLWQYFHSNSMEFNVNYFGVSAQGGDVSDPMIKQRLLDIFDSCDRIKVIDNEKMESHNIALPLSALLRRAK